MGCAIHGRMSTPPPPSPILTAATAAAATAIERLRSVVHQKHKKRIAGRATKPLQIVIYLRQVFDRKEGWEPQSRLKEGGRG